MYSSSGGDNHIRDIRDQFEIQGGDQQVVDFVASVVANNTPVSVTARPGNRPGRLEYQVLYDVDGEQLVVAIGDNGFIVSAYPYSER